MLNTVFRSATHATLSTLTGCNPNSKATIRLRPILPVMRDSNRNKITASMACSKRLVK